MERQDPFVHLNPIPAWQKKADSYIYASVPPLANAPNEECWEQLWSRWLGNDKFEICCIPFFAYGFALRDEVIVNQDHEIIRLHKPSGNLAVRIWFFEKTSDHDKEKMIAILSSNGNLMEWSSKNLLAVNSPSQADAQKILKILKGYLEKGLIACELGNRV